MPLTKPTDDIEWAESADPGDVTDPAAKRSGGWQVNDPLPSAGLNYLLRAAGRFAEFAADKFDSTGEKLTLGSVNADLEVTVDNALASEWTFTGGAFCAVKADAFTAQLIQINPAAVPAIAFDTEGELIYSEPSSGASLWSFENNEPGGQSEVSANQLTALREVEAPNAPRLAGLVSIVGDGADTAQIAGVTPVLGFNIGTAVIATPAARRRVRVTLAAGQLTQGVVTASVVTNDETRDMYATVVAIMNGATPAQIDIVIRDNAGVDVMGVGGLLSGEDIQLHVVAY
jgi:hypothetical protein